MHRLDGVWAHRVVDHGLVCIDCGQGGRGERVGVRSSCGGILFVQAVLVTLVGSRRAAARPFWMRSSWK